MTTQLESRASAFTSGYLQALDMPMYGRANRSDCAIFEQLTDETDVNSGSDPMYAISLRNALHSLRVPYIDEVLHEFV